ncbi:MAG: hypothetical protein AAF458_23365 [Pseudomonadota bacterium]
MGSVEIAFVREQDARGEVESVFADIRAVMRIGTVNLIWRHLAMDAAVLQAAWAVARPLYVRREALEQAVADTVVRLGRPDLTPWSDDAWADAGLAYDDRRRIAGVIATYNRGNAFNLLALSALLAPAGGKNHDRSEPRDVDALLPPPPSDLPSVPELHELEPGVAELVTRLNGLGLRRPAGGIVATLYKHLALWPGMLNLTWSLLEPLERSHTLVALVEQCAACSADAAGSLAAEVGRWERDDLRERAQASISLFVDSAICRMLPVGLLLRDALNEGGPPP